MSSIYKINKRGPKMEPCGMPDRTGSQWDVLPLTVKCIHATKTCDIISGRDQGLCIARFNHPCYT